MIPGMEPILLDLENLFLLSVSLEILLFNDKLEQKLTKKYRFLKKLEKIKKNHCIFPM